MNSRLVFLLAPLILLVSGCSSQTYSIRELGHPAFESVVGKETAFERADEEQRKGLDAFTSDVQASGDHSFIVSFWPAGSEDKIGLEIRARAKGKLSLERLAAAVFAVSRKESSTFSLTGALPAPRAPIAFSGESEEDEELDEDEESEDDELDDELSDFADSDEAPDPLLTEPERESVR